MKKLLLSLSFLLGLAVSAQAQCIAVGGVNNVPQPGMACLSEPVEATYVASGIGIVPAASVTDLACISGGAGVTVRVQAIRLSGTAGTTLVVPAVILKRATADTGGTSAATTALPVPSRIDSTNAAAVATTIAYTANPTINDSSPLIVDVANLILSTTAAGTSPSPFTLFDWTNRNYSQAPILRGAAQQLCVNLNATSPASGLVNVAFRWTELSQ